MPWSQLYLLMCEGQICHSIACFRLLFLILESRLCPAILLVQPEPLCRGEPRIWYRRDRPVQAHLSSSPETVNHDVFVQTTKYSRMFWSVGRLESIIY